MGIYTDDQQMIADAAARFARDVLAPGAAAREAAGAIEPEVIQGLADMGLLNVSPPDLAPHVTDYIPAIVGQIQAIVDAGCAYAAEGHVLFDVRSFPDYGQLSGRSVDDMIAGARVEVAPYKRDPADFVLKPFPSAARSEVAVGTGSSSAVGVTLMPTPPKASIIRS